MGNPPAAPLQPCEEGQRCKSNMPHVFVIHLKFQRTFRCLLDVQEGSLHDCRVHWFNLRCSPHTLIAGCSCSWVSQGAFTTHDEGLGASGSEYIENTPWRSRLGGVVQHFHIVAVIKSLLESRERCVPPMDSSGL